MPTLARDVGGVRRCEKRHGPSRVLRCLRPLHPRDRLGAGEEGLLELAAIARTPVAPELSRNSLLRRGRYRAEGKKSAKRRQNEALTKRLPERTYPPRIAPRLNANQRGSRFKRFSSIQG
jgi:hypothetical protein